MRKKERMFKILCSPACLWIVCMTAGGGASIVISDTWDRPFYVEVAGEVQEDDQGNGTLQKAGTIGGKFGEEGWESSPREMSVLSWEAEGNNAGKWAGELLEEDRPSRLNFAFYYDDGVPAEDVSQSYAGKAYQALLKQDSSWISEIYGLRHVSPETMAVRLGKDKSSVTGIRHLNGVPLEGAENAQVIPSWNRFNVTFYNGDGTAVIGHSNSKEIMSLASVYAYFNQEKSCDFLLSYVAKLWQTSHSYKISVSNVYYCQGECLYRDDHNSWDEEDFQTGGNEDWGQGSSELEGIMFSGSAEAAWQADSTDAARGMQGNGEAGQEMSRESQEPAAPSQWSGETIGQGAGQGSYEPAESPQWPGETAGQEMGRESYETAESPQWPGETAGQEMSGESYETAESPQWPGETAGQEMGQESYETAESPQWPGETVGQGAGREFYEPDGMFRRLGELAGQGISQVSLESVSDSQSESELSQETDQISHEPIPASQLSEEASVQETGQASQELIPAEQPQWETSQETGQISHEPIPASQLSGEGTSQEMGQVSAEPVWDSQPTGEPGEEEGQISGELIAPVQASGAGGSSGGSEQEAEQNSPISGAAGSKYCQGHIDLNISAVIVGMDGAKNLFTQSASFAGHESSGSWNGWDDTARDYARTIAGQDWFAEYGITGQETMSVRDPLSGSEVARYMSMLPADTSQKRRKVVQQALLSIGCIPYYWGGKPSCGGFEGNGFGTVVSPDEDGRILKGLDCSGWINWVYWTAFGSSLPAESTSGLMSCGRAVEKGDLQAGDILIRAGEQPHVYLFLAWAPDGSMYLIHETTGNVNNVTIGTYDLDLPYYRCLINEE